MSNSQLHKLKSVIKNWTEVTSNLSSNLIDNPIDETNFPHKLLLLLTQVSKIRKTFTNGSSTNIKFPKTQLPKIVQLEEVLFGPIDLVNKANELFEQMNKRIDFINETNSKRIREYGK